MTAEERAAWVEAHIKDYKMSQEEAEAVVDSMTDTEIELARKNGFGAKEETLSDVLKRLRDNAPAAPVASQRPQAEDVQTAFFAAVQMLCAHRGNKVIETADFTENCAKVVNWIKGGRKWLLLSGKVGNGKTTAGRAAFLTLKKTGLAGLDKNAYDIALLYREINRNPRAAIEYDNIARCPLLFLDDLGTESNATALSEILYERYNNMRFTIFTTNLTGAELAAKYGARIFDRFEELAEVVHFAGSSFRAKNKQATLWK